MIRMDRFGTHVIRGFYVYHLFYASKQFQTVHVKQTSNRDSRVVFSANAEREVRFRQCQPIHTHKAMLKYPFWQVFW